ncbi:VanZ family protein [Flavobacterium sp. RHBU_3]|uniref:VanZ family protein n=1 Tax=Flavobacterium sp. RHBU_3 TaxID=3391184 RepID=UPI0039848BAF
MKKGIYIKALVFSGVAYAYFIAIIYLTIISANRYDGTGDGHDAGHVNMVLFSAKRYYLDNFFELAPGQIMFISKEIIGNLLLFFPFALCLYVASGRKFSKKKEMLILTAVVFCIESIQYIFSIGVFDIDDFVLNTLGGLVGVYIFETLYKKKIL